MVDGSSCFGRLVAEYIPWSQDRLQVANLDDILLARKESQEKTNSSSCTAAAAAAAAAAYSSPFLVLFSAGAVLLFVVYPKNLRTLRRVKKND